MSEKMKKSAMEVASNYLANRMRTVAEVRKRLIEKEFDETEIDETINNLIGLRYLDDYEYAKKYYEYNAEKKRGSFRAIRELEEKGVDKETIKFALEDFKFESKIDEYKMALSVAENEIENVKIVDEKLVAKIGRNLNTRGFKKDDIFKVIEKVREKINYE